MAITRYSRRSPFLSPWQELEAVSNRLNRLFVEPASGEARDRSAWSPSVNVEETQEEILLTAELPGMSIDDVEIEVENNVLSLRGEKKAEIEEKDDRRFHVWERCTGSFQRQFTLPRTVQVDKINANFKDGILYVQMPKAPQAKPKKIAIKAEG
mgnify:CR=1 FL=1